VPGSRLRIAVFGAIMPPTRSCKRKVAVQLIRGAGQDQGVHVMEDKPGYRLSASVHEGILEIVIAGEVTKDAMDGLQADAIALIRELGAKAVLCDVRALNGPHNFGETYFRVKGMPQDVKIWSAVVELPNDVAYQSFHETAAANAGWSLRWFTDVDAARAWLGSKLRESDSQPAT
jgi:hypothetical protein